MDRFLDYVLRQLIEFPEEMIILKDEAPKLTIFRLQLRQSDIAVLVTDMARYRPALQAAFERLPKRIY